MLYEFTVRDFSAETLEYREVQRIESIKKEPSGRHADVVYVDDKGNKQTEFCVVALRPAPIVEFDLRK